MKSELTIERDPGVSIEQVVVVRFLRGDGVTNGSTVRLVTQVRRMDGQLIAEDDPFPGAGKAEAKA